MEKEIYKPFRSDKPDKKFFILTGSGHKVYFGAKGYEDFTMHKDEKRKMAYVKRHERHENWNDPDTAGFWSRWYLWNKPTLEESYRDIQERFFFS
jgi:hypothetical protein